MDLESSLGGSARLAASSSCCGSGSTSSGDQGSRALEAARPYIRDCLQPLNFFVASSTVLGAQRTSFERYFRSSQRGFPRGSSHSVAYMGPLAKTGEPPMTSRPVRRHRSWRSTMRIGRLSPPRPGFNRSRSPTQRTLRRDRCGDGRADSMRRCRRTEPRVHALRVDEYSGRGSRCSRRDYDAADCFTACVPTIRFRRAPTSIRNILPLRQSRRLVARIVIPSGAGTPSAGDGSQLT